MGRRILLISIAATLVGMGLLRLYMQRFEDEVRGGATTPVVVLIKDAPAGTAVTRDLLDVRKLPQAYLESRHVLARDIEQVLDARLGVAVRANEALLFTDLASMRQPLRQLSNLVPQGMRGFTLTQGLGALDVLLSPGDRVDVLLVPGRDLSGHDGDGATVLLAQNLLVLAVGQDLGDPAEPSGTARSRSRSVTLSVTVPQSKTLAGAERQGALRLILRNPDDITLNDEPRHGDVAAATTVELDRKGL